MRKFIAIFIATGMLIAGSTANSFSMDKKHKKHHKKFFLFMHKRHDRLQKWNTGHTEFKNRAKRDKKKMNRHHMQP